jgi:hypothetical protein
LVTVSLSKPSGLLVGSEVVSFAIDKLSTICLLEVKVKRVIKQKSQCGNRAKTRISYKTDHKMP